MLKIIAIPAFSDNYLWLLHNGKRAVVFDPGDAAPVQRALLELGLPLDAILITHHHTDHIGGVAQLRSQTSAKVYGPATEKIPEPYVRLGEDDSVTALGLEFQVFDVPGHTAGHIAYYAAPSPQLAGEAASTTADNAPLLFCGDTLFSGGCGRLFEGTPAQMLASLDKLAALPGQTRVYCTHEYTLSNLRFALVVDPDNAELTAYQTHCLELREQGQPTLPTTIAQELLINPFLRSRRPALVAAAHQFDAQAHDETTVFAAIRQWKNQFK